VHGVQATARLDTVRLFRRGYSVRIAEPWGTPSQARSAELSMDIHASCWSILFAVAGGAEQGAPLTPLRHRKSADSEDIVRLAMVF